MRKVPSGAIGGEGMSKTVTYPPGQLLFKEGDAGGGLYILRRGRVQVFHHRNGVDLVLAELQAGDVLGTMTLLTGERRSASVRALSEVEAAFLDAKSFAADLSNLPKWAEVVIKDLTARVKALDDIVAEASLQDRRLRLQISNLFHHLGQLAHYIAFVIRNTSREDEDLGGEITPFKNVLVQAETVLNLRNEYLAQLWEHILEAGLMQESKDYHYGVVLRNAKSRTFEALGDFAYHTARKGLPKERPKAREDDDDVRRRQLVFDKLCRNLIESETLNTQCQRAYF
jgi:CRP/FNR family transcriptional regulator